MNDLGYFFAKIRYKLLGSNHEVMCRFFRSKGIMIGNNVKINCNIMTPEPYLITIGNNVTIANDVQFVTHDNSVSKICPEFTDFFGKISIGDNCFIGARSLLLYGVTIPENTIVAAGSVVTKVSVKNFTHIQQAKEMRELTWT